MGTRREFLENTFDWRILLDDNFLTSLESKYMSYLPHLRYSDWAFQDRLHAYGEEGWC